MPAGISTQTAMHRDIAHPAPRRRYATIASDLLPAVRSSFRTSITDITRRSSLPTLIGHVCALAFCQDLATRRRPMHLRLEILALGLTRFITPTVRQPQELPRAIRSCATAQVLRLRQT